MKKQMITVLAFCGVAFLGACGNEDANDPHLVPEIVDAQIQVPETVKIGEDTKLSVRLAQGEEQVEDAHEVVFEVWKDQERDNGTLEEAPHQENGVYGITHTFEEDGIYIVQTHVTARDMHVMPKQMIVAGDVSEEEVEAFQESEGNSNDEEESQHHH
ncbi:FixH family protein [Shouchella patagoniensis]|uniref:FixH family protein n=1 Tax=Shouchella patagoniensis TaxID=228576 RepID=UPI000994F8B7|nr:FixH family protein [Shouchella patagoniensis]